MLRFISILIPLFLCRVSSCARQSSFPPAERLYSSAFVEPQPPNITTEFRANYMQHKYDVNVNHITSGFIYMSPSNAMVRMDSDDNDEFKASLFDFSNTTADGLVSNIEFTFIGGPLTNPQCLYYFVRPFTPLMTPDILSVRGAVYTGIQYDEIHGPVSTWLFMDVDVAVTMFLDSNNTLVRYDYAGPGSLRTYATTRFFNIIHGPINATVFETPCQRY